MRSSKKYKNGQEQMGQAAKPLLCILVSLVILLLPFTTGAYVFTKFLTKGSRGSEVMELQKALKTDPLLYPEGLVTGYFGNLTEAAVRRFQSKYGIVNQGTPVSTGFGVVGPKTRAKLNQLFGGVNLPTYQTVPYQTLPAAQPDSCQNQSGNVCEDCQVCDGTILSVAGSNRCCKGTCKLPRSFDWRNVHGENWLTSVKSQGSIGTCHEFGIVGTFEAQVNLYYNQHINLDLSEQMYVDCAHGTSPIIDFGAAKKQCEDIACWGSMFCKEMSVGLVDESCSRYVGRDIFCDGLYQSTQEDKCCSSQTLCQDWKNRMWKNAGFMEYTVPPFYGHSMCQYHQLINTDTEIKQILIEKGPIKASVAYEYIVPGGLGNHSMVLVGYDEPNVWIFKNSWGEQYMDKGYVSINTANVQLFADMGVPVGPFTPPSGQSYQIRCVDKDNDSFCNWGISKNKPSTCPAFCKPEKDWDDSKRNIGALGIY